jgi:hypothetical protein
MAYPHPSYAQSTTAAATASTIQAARYGAYTPSYQRPYVPGAQQSPYLPQQANYTQMFPMLHQQPQPLLNQAPAKQEDDSSPDKESSSAALQYFVFFLLEAAGFAGSEKQALDVLKKEAISGKFVLLRHSTLTYPWNPVVENLYQDARSYAYASHRQSPTALDLAQACLNNGLTPRDLWRTVNRGKRKRKRAKGVLTTFRHNAY